MIILWLILIIPIILIGGCLGAGALAFGLMRGAMNTTKLKPVEAQSMRRKRPEILCAW